MGLLSFRNEEEGSPEVQNVSVKLIAALVLFLALLWGVDYWILRDPILTTFSDGSRTLNPLSPMYAFLRPVIRPEALVFLVVSAIFVISSSFALDEEKVNTAAFAAFLFISFCVLAAALFLIREDLPGLAGNLTIYPKEEVYYDARRIGSIGDFIANYKVLQPELSMRGQHYPPGGATFLYIVASILGEGLWKVGAAILVVAATGVTLCYGGMKQILPELNARQSALLLAASPSLLNFSCTSMDAFFFFLASLSLMSGLMIVSPHAEGSSFRFRSHIAAASTGLFLFLACFTNFSAFPLGMCLMLFLIFQGGKRIKETVINLALVGAGFLGMYLFFQLFFGYSLLENLSYAREHNFEFMAGVLNGPASDYYAYAVYGNISAFLIGCGIAVTGAVASSATDIHFRWTPWRLAALISLLVMSFGGMFVMETERIWLFAIPWMTIFALSAGPFRPSSLRLLMTCGLMQAFLMEMFLFTLW